MKKYVINPDGTVVSQDYRKEFCEGASKSVSYNGFAHSTHLSYNSDIYPEGF